MIDDLITRALAGCERPKDRAALERELEQARLKGFRVPDIDLDRQVITEAQAHAALARLGLALGAGLDPGLDPRLDPRLDPGLGARLDPRLDPGLNPGALFYAVMAAYRRFPPGRGAELYDLDAIEKAADSGAWEEDFPGFARRFLQLSSSEGEGSYFYAVAGGAVFDAGWNDMEELAAGRLPARWASYAAFLHWYYADHA